MYYNVFNKGIFFLLRHFDTSCKKKNTVLSKNQYKVFYFASPYVKFLIIFIHIKKSNNERK